jgi:hypothetical protein
MAEQEKYLYPNSIQNLPSFVIEELLARSNQLTVKNKENAVFGFVPAGSKNHGHPRTVWSRVCSNFGRGFVFENSEKTMGFKNTYNIGNNAGSIIGYDPVGNPHIVRDDPMKNRPLPQIESIENSSAEGDSRQFRVSTIKWICWSKSQLEYIAPYFLNPGVSLIIEYGWVYGNEPLKVVDLKDTNALANMVNTTGSFLEMSRKNSGNYDISYGFVTGYTFDPRPDGGFTCTTTIKHPGGIYSGLAYLDNSSDSTGEEGKEKKKASQTVLTFLDNTYGYLNLPSAAGELHRLGISNNIGAQIFYGRCGFTTSGRYSPYKSRLGKKVEVTNTRIKDFNAKQAAGGSAQPFEGDFDFGGDTNDWWMSMENLFFWINKIVAKDNKIISFDISKSIISAHPNIKSSNGKVLLIPNSKSPERYQTFSFLGPTGVGAIDAEIQNLQDGIDTNNRKLKESDDSLAAMSEKAKDVRVYSGFQTPREANAELRRLTKIGNANLQSQIDVLIKKKNELVGEHSTTSPSDADAQFINSLDTTTYKNVKVVRKDLNKIINWWDSDPDSQSRRAFPANVADGEITTDEKDRGCVGYLKNLYVHQELVKSELESAGDVKTAVMEILKKMNAAAGNIWSFDIVQLDPLSPSTLTVIDRNCTHKASNLTSYNDLFDFSYLTPSGILSKMAFSVKLSDSQTTQILFESMTPPIKNAKVSDYKFQFRIQSDQSDPESKEVVTFDRIFNDGQFKPAPTKGEETTTEEKKKQVALTEKIKQLSQTSPQETAYTYTFSDDTSIRNFATLVEPDISFLKETMFGLHNENLADSIVQPNLSLEITMQGISGMRTLQCFSVSELPKPYGTNCVFQIRNVKHVVQNGKWETLVECAVRPTRALFKETPKK